MIRQISDFFAKFWPHRDIWKKIDGVDTLYLRRFYLTPRSWPVRVFLHNIFRSDDDPDCHDHPWDFSSLVLWNGYTETIQSPRNYFLKSYQRIYAPSFRKMLATHIHKVTLDEKKPAVTLVFAKKAKRVWGFWTQNGWVDWRTYLNLPGLPDHLEDALD